MISPAHLAKVRSNIELGPKEGATLLAGGLDAPDLPESMKRGNFVRPTVFGDVRNNMRIAQEEIFGPVACLIPFEDEADAVQIANDCVYGLGGAVWSADPIHARSVASQLRTGRVRINGAALDKRGTHGGFKLSGVGREWGRIGIEEFLEYQSVIG
jgi:acyl-CoA reductase-like NAD-dependent aldehyde dehydrogenase